MTIDKALHALAAFERDSLIKSLSGIERQIIGSGVEVVDDFCTQHGIDGDFMDSAIAVKRVAGQINAIIHAVGILRSLAGLLQGSAK